MLLGLEDDRVRKASTFSGCLCQESRSDYRNGIGGYKRTLHLLPAQMTCLAVESVSQIPNARGKTIAS